MVLFVLSKLILQTHMRSHPVGLDNWFLVGSFVYFHTLCMRIAKALARPRGCAGSPEPSLAAYVISTIISWAGLFYVSHGDFGWQENPKFECLMTTYRFCVRRCIPEGFLRHILWEIIILDRDRGDKYLWPHVSNLLLNSCIRVDPFMPGAVARSEACPLGMQTAPSSIQASDTFFRGDLVMKTISKAILPLRWFKKSSCQLLAKEYALSTGKLPRRLAQEQCG